MANANVAYGGKPIRHLNGSPYNGAANLYYIPASDSSNYFIGDFVKSTGTSDATTGVATVIIAAAGDVLRGVVVGFVPNPDTPQLMYRPASTYMGVWVMDDPDVIISIQASAAYAITNVGENANIVVGAGSIYTGVSGTQLDSTSYATTSTLQLKVLGPVLTADNTVGTNTKLLCLMNSHELKVGTTGV